jgi:hypothetical protein
MIPTPKPRRCPGPAGPHAGPDPRRRVRHPLEGRTNPSDPPGSQTPAAVGTAAGFPHAAQLPSATSTTARHSPLAAATVSNSSALPKSETAATTALPRCAALAPAPSIVQTTSTGCRSGTPAAPPSRSPPRAYCKGPGSRYLPNRPVVKLEPVFKVELVPASQLGRAAKK